MTREEFKAKAKEVIDNEQFGIFGALFEYESFEEMKVAHIPNDLCSAESDMPLGDFLDKLYERIKQEPVLDQIRAEIKEWYWQADKQALAKDPCVVDAMVDLFIRTIKKYQGKGD